MTKRDVAILTDVALITCVVQRGAEKITQTWPRKPGPKGPR